MLESSPTSGIDTVFFPGMLLVHNQNMNIHWFSMVSRMVVMVFWGLAVVIVVYDSVSNPHSQVAS